MVMTTHRDCFGESCDRRANRSGERESYEVARRRDRAALPTKAYRSMNMAALGRRNAIPQYSAKQRGRWHFAKHGVRLLLESMVSRHRGLLGAFQPITKLDWLVEEEYQSPDM